MLAIYIVDVVGWRHYFLREKVIMAVDDICFMSVSRVCGVVFGLWFAHLVEHMLFFNRVYLRNVVL